MRKFVEYKIPEYFSFKENLLRYAKKFPRCCVLDSNSAYDSPHSEFSENQYDCIAGIDSVSEIIPAEDSFESLKKFHFEKKDWLFGFLSYDLKNEIEASLFTLLSRGRGEGGEVGFPLMHFFQPEYIFCLTPPDSYRDLSTDKDRDRHGEGARVEIGFLPEVSSEEKVKNMFEEILSLNHKPSTLFPPPAISSRISREEYIRTVNKIKYHIQRGDIYEMNYCMEFFSERAEINPVEIFLNLNKTSQAPFSAFYRMGDNYLLCASPERFLKKEERKIISQPIKGTARRGKTVQEDLELKESLFQNAKERSENAMIVDLVRNDLSRTCDNVKVEELFGIYTFKQWHQMISTVSGEMKKDVHFTEVIKNAFPMGSMTGAPKIRAMELIEKFEKTKRGLYSGAVGYLTPDPSPAGERGWKGGEDFDFNVVIRSILYNASSKYLSFQAGSAITANSVPENEYEECLLKAKGMLEALGIYSPLSLRESSF